MDSVIEALESLKVPIDSVKPDPRNTRHHPARNLKAIMDSLDAYGQRKPIVVNAKTMTIEAGNGMWEAAKALGWDEIAVALVKDDKIVASAYGIMDNQSALLAEWDLPNLKELLAELDDGGTNMVLTGFEEDEIEALTATPGALKHFDINRQATPIFGIRVGVIAATRWKRRKDGESGDYKRFLEWKSSPSSHPELTIEMAGDISNILREMFVNWRGFIITVPPQGVSQGGEYPAGFLGKQVAADLGVDFVTVFDEYDGEKKHHFPHESLRMGSEPYKVLTDVNMPIVIIDDAISSGATAKRCLEARPDKLTFFIAWIKNQGRW